MNLENIVLIRPVSIWANGGAKLATKFYVSSVSYDNAGIATGFYSLLDANDVNLLSSSIMATAEQTAAWTDDLDFYKVLAGNAGLTVL